MARRLQLCPIRYLADYVLKVAEFGQGGVVGQAMGDALEQLITGVRLIGVFGCLAIRIDDGGQSPTGAVPAESECSQGVRQLREPPRLVPSALCCDAANVPLNNPTQFVVRKRDGVVGQWTIHRSQATGTGQQVARDRVIAECSDVCAVLHRQQAKIIRIKGEQHVRRRYECIQVALFLERPIDVVIEFRDLILLIPGGFQPTGGRVIVVLHLRSACVGLRFHTPLQVAHPPSGSSQRVNNCVQTATAAPIVVGDSAQGILHRDQLPQAVVS